MTEHERLNLYLGWPTLANVWGNRIAPRLMDLYLGKTGFQSQQTGEDEPADRPDNLFAPVDGDFAAHGRFDARAKPSSPLLFWMTRGKPLAVAILGAGTLGFFAAARRVLRA